VAHSNVKYPKAGPVRETLQNFSVAGDVTLEVIGITWDLSRNGAEIILGHLRSNLQKIGNAPGQTKILSWLPICKLAAFTWPVIISDSSLFRSNVSEGPPRFPLLFLSRGLVVAELAFLTFSWAAGGAAKDARELIFLVPFYRGHGEHREQLKEK
jgi:hypothetical protein